MQHLTRFTLLHPRTTAALLLLVTVFLLSGLPGLRDEYGFRVLLGEDHPFIAGNDAMIAQFGGSLPALIAWECGPGRPCERALDAASLRMADSLSGQLRAARGVRSVHGPSDSPLLVDALDGFEIRHLVENGAIPDDLIELERAALRDPNWVGDLVSPDGTVGVIIVQQVDSSSATNLEVVGEIERLIRPHVANGYEFALGGTGVATVVAGRELAASTSRIIPFTVLVIGIVVLFLSRSLGQTLATLATLGISLVWTLGLMGWLDWPRDGIHQVLAPLVLLVGVCDAMHVLTRYGSGDPRASRIDRMASAAQDVGTACLVTTLTTAGALLSFMTSDLDTFQRFGAIAAFGVCACLVNTFTALPLIAVRIPQAGTVESTRRWRVALERVVGLTRAQSRPILLGSAALLTVCGYGWIDRLQVGTTWEELLGSDSTVRRWDRFFDERLRSTETVEIRIDLPDSDPLELPSTLDRLKRISVSIGAIEGVGKPRTVLDRIARARSLLHGDDGDAPPPTSRAANAEILEILALGSPDDILRWTSMDRSSVRLSAMAAPFSSQQSSNIIQAVSGVLDRTLPEGWTAFVGGSAAANAIWVRDVQATQLRSFPVALLVAIALLALYFRSPIVTLAALVPTIMPAVLAIGAMAWMGLSLDIGRSMVGAILIGVGVDDAVHLLTHYLRHRREGASVDESLRVALDYSGRAITTTSVSLSVGFLTLSASAWQTVASFGLIIAISLVGALCATLLVVPSALFALDAPTETVPRSNPVAADLEAD